jgi:hypothetical protein
VDLGAEFHSRLVGRSLDLYQQLALVEHHGDGDFAGRAGFSKDTCCPGDS